jgi:hypothetical protein
MNLEKLDDVAMGGARVMCTLFGGGDDATDGAIVFCAVAWDFCNHVHNLYSTTKYHGDEIEEERTGARGREKCVQNFGWRTSDE